MIARISGLLLCKFPTHVIVDVHGIGYRVFVPLTTFYELPETGQQVTLNIHTHVKQDAINLFGFDTQEAKDIFQLMISVSGIGPKLAMNILSGISAGELLRAVSQGNRSRLVSIPGVGNKMAERLILELKDRFGKLSFPEDADMLGVGMTQTELMQGDALSALINLGYKRDTARVALDRAMNGAAETDTSLDIVLKKTLQILAG
jgi:Holliday junction DNA helicase RuvA